MGLGRYRTLLLSRYRARFVLYRQIEQAADAETRPLALLRLAEALAWVSDPDQPHGTAIVAVSGEREGTTVVVRRRRRRMSGAPGAA
jgi:hypothetical protein